MFGQRPGRRASLTAAAALAAVGLLLQLTPGFAALAVLAAAAALAATGRGGWRDTPRLAAAAVMLVAMGAAAGAAISADPRVSLVKLCSVLTGLALFLLLMRTRPTELGPVLWLLIAFGCLLGLAAVVQVDRNSWKLNAYNQSIYELFGRIPRVSDVALNQNAISAWLICLLPLALALAATTHGRGRWLASAAAVWLTFQLSLTNSRSAILSLGLGLAMGCLVLGKRWRMAGGAVLAGALALLFSGVIGLPFHLSLLPTGGSSRERLGIWISALHMLADAPFSGLGLGQFQRVYPAYILPENYIDHPHAHNLLLQAGVDSGVLGVIGWLLVITFTAACVYRLVHSPPGDWQERLHSAGMTASAVALLAHAQVDCYFLGDARNCFFVFVPLGLLASCAPARRLAPEARFALHRASQRPSAAPPPPVGIEFHTPDVWHVPRPRIAHGFSAVSLGVPLVVLGLCIWQWPLLASEWLVNAGTVQMLKAGAGTETHPLAHERFLAAVNLDPRNWVAERALGDLELRQGSSAAALQHLDAARSWGPPSPLIAFELGSAYAGRGDSLRAVDQWRAAHAAPFFAREGNDRADRGEAALAEASFHLALDIEPGQPDASEGLARLEARRGEWLTAEAVLRAESQVHPDSSAAWAMLGMLAYAHDGDLPAARALLAKAIDASPTDESLYRAMAGVEQSSGRPDLAATWEQRGERALAQRGRPTDTLGGLYELVGRPAEAEREYRRVAYGSPSDPVGHYRLGKLAESQANDDGARSELTLAVQAIPNQENFRLALARLDLKMGDTTAAQAQYQAVLDLDPGNLEASRYLKPRQAR